MSAMGSTQESGEVLILEEEHFDTKSMWVKICVVLCISLIRQA